MNLSETRKIVNKKLADYRALVRQYKTEKESLTIEEEQLINITEAQKIAQRVAQAVQQQAHNQIAGVVSKCLETVFDKPYVFKINFERKRGKTEAQLVFESDGFEIDPMTASGGGVVDVASFALRLSCLMLAKPKLRRILIMDEPFKFVSEIYQENVRLMLESLSKEFKIQFIIVTHINMLKVGKVIQI
jgi:DNA repair exonuclease SbcCD ATPase subunit